ncbi:hypothetical protein [Pseudomonas lurida]|uniref:hypothetical protein n=1 Tax=Pseudomonas lurida TaxID=244566 RepID=UPI00177A8117|nr:hypothetical protein [Pseudomonas lurida]MBD8671596.1 hypothetical protein [Pseudomonas lurida]
MQQLEQRAPIITNDYGLILPHQVEPFRAWLKRNGCVTKDGGAGQFFHVKTALGWAPVQRGARNKVVTPLALRPVISDFQSARPAPAFSSPDNILVQVAEPACAPIAANDVPASSRVLSLAGKTGSVPSTSSAPAAEADAPCVSVAENDALYLSDLRDDFAVHAYLPMKKDEPLHDYALRRWEFASLMVQLRSTPGRG